MKNLTPFAWLSIAAAVATIILKSFAYYLTGSVGLLSDAMESVVNLLAGVMALAMLTIAARPPDEDHEFGHTKAEYFSSGAEGGLIVIAAISIAWAAVNRLLHPRPLEQLGVGLGVSAVASLINFVVARILLSAGKEHCSITLEADGHHLMTDVWTSIGVVFGVGAVVATGWLWLDPVVAMGVAANIVRIGYRLVQRSVLGLMDASLPQDERAQVMQILDRYRKDSVQFHAIRTRQSGARRFVSLHVLVPGAWSVQQGHELVEQIEEDIRSALPNAAVLTHLEPLEDPASWDDERP